MISFPRSCVISRKDTSRHVISLSPNYAIIGRKRRACLIFENANIRDDTRGAKYFFPNRFIYGAVLSLWTQTSNKYSWHTIFTLYSVNTPLIATPCSWRIGKALLSGSKGWEFESSHSQQSFAIWILDNLFGGGIAPGGTHFREDTAISSENE